MKVWPANENMQKLLKHPISKQGFADMNTGANWPDDSFTFRRVRDGDVLTEAPSKGTRREETTE
jgi:hypothetical protein